MAKDSLVTEEMRNKIGIQGEPLLCEIEGGMIRRFVLAIDDPNPLWQDEEYAKKSRYGGTIAPPTFIPIVGYREFLQQVEALAGTLLHGSTELECYQPVRAGDTITVTTKVANVRERQSKKMGKMAFVTFDMTYENQRQEQVAKCRQVIICYQV